MIPPYSATYSYSELSKCIRLSSKDTTEIELCSRLRGIYNKKYVHLFNTARAALYYLLRAYERPGGVIIPSFTCITVPEAIKFAGYYPEFVDVYYPSLDMDLKQLVRAINSEVTVILGIHTFGLPCHVEEIREIAHYHNLIFVEDAAPAIGGEYRGQIVGSFGDVSILSFNHGKVVSGEDGGALLTDNPEIDQAVQKLIKAELVSNNRGLSLVKAILRKMQTNPWLYSIKNKVQKKDYDEILKRGIPPTQDIPSSYRNKCSPISSALILQQLENLDSNLMRRKKIGQIYQEELANLSWLILPTIPRDCSPTWVQFPVFVQNKIDFYHYMKKCGIDMSMNYPYSVAESFSKENFVNSRQVVDTIIGFPTYPMLTDLKIKSICDKAKGFIHNHKTFIGDRVK